MITPEKKSWVEIPAYSFTQRDEILLWAQENNIDLEFGGQLVKATTFEPIQRWFISTEEDKTLFLLKWGNQ